MSSLSSDRPVLRPRTELADAIWDAVALPAHVAPASPEAYRIWRDGYDRFGDGLPRPADTRIAAVDVSGVHTEVVTATDVSHSVVLVAHGGGYILGSAVSHRNFAAHLSARTEAAVVTPSYRLSPESAYPDALDDLTAAYRFLIHRGHRAADIVVCGDSAGGGLVLALLQRLQHQGVPLPAGGVLISSWADMTRPDSPSRTRWGMSDPMYDAAFFELMTAGVVGGGRPDDPLVSPVFGDFRGLPPLLVQVGAEEALRDDSEAIVVAAEAAGVDVTLQVLHEAVHNIQVFPGFWPAGDPAWDVLGSVATFVRTHTGRGAELSP